MSEEITNNSGQPPTQVPASAQPGSTPPVSAQAVSTPPVSAQAVSTPPVSAQAVSTPPVSAQAVSTPPVSAQAVSTPPLPGENGEFAKLVFHGAGGEVIEKNVLRPTTLIGSGESCNIKLVSQRVAPAHAVVTFDSRDFRLWDLRSSVGTFVNDAQVTFARLNHGDKVRIGKFEFEFLTNYQPINRKGFFIDDYRVLGILGTGGMGWLYAVEHYRSQEKFALKVLTRRGDDRGVDDEELRKRFEFEGRAGQMMEHPNVVRAYGIETRDDADFIKMELCESITLQELVEREKKLPYSFVAHIGRQSALGLEHVHQQGPVHRDVKPANILIEHDGTVKLCDFGLVMLGNDPEEAKLAEKLKGDCLGTADFISPEQSYNSYAVDARADIYSLGCSLYYGFAARPPFMGEKNKHKIKAHRQEIATPLSKLIPGFPEELSRVIEKTMAKSADDRFATAAELAEALAPFSKPMRIKFDFDRLLEQRTELAQARILDRSRSHHLSRIPANVAAGILDSAMKAKPQQSDESQVQVQVRPEAGDTAPAGASPMDYMGYQSPELQRVCDNWYSLPSETQREILRLIRGEVTVIR